MDTFVGEKRRITLEKAVALLKAEGIAISAEEAEQLVEFLYFLAEILIGDVAAE